MTQTIGEMDKSSTEKIVVTLGEYKGKQRIDMRVYFQPDADPGNWKPTKKGINIDLDSWGEFKDLVGKVDRAITKKD